VLDCGLVGVAGLVWVGVVVVVVEPLPVAVKAAPPPAASAATVAVREAARCAAGQL
jgi:hypothetical protein